MGVYMYKVTAKRKTLPDGTEANIAVFAYKPSWDEARNRRAAKASSCHVAERYVRDSANYTGRVVLGETGDFPVPCNCGTFTDAWYDTQVGKIRERDKISG